MSQKITKKDLPSKYDQEKTYQVGKNTLRLKDLPDDAVIKFKDNGEIDKRTFSQLIDRTPAKKPDSPQKLREMFQGCFSENEVQQLISRAKYVAIQQGDKNMLKFLVEQLFGKAPQNVSHSGDSDNPVEIVKRKQIDQMDSGQLDEYLNKLYGTQNGRGK